ncbi:hypothetical protein ACQE3D_17445 [Methylomonas sp. MS20]|uniref:hypothetical protein n=1 Tax=Methylomonas sp. MS20 TaxID=3418769 RepID=UPI003D0206FF
MPTIYRIKSENLSTRRIDPWHYQPDFSKQISKITTRLCGNELYSLIDQKREVAGGATPLGANYLETGRVRFYRTSEVDELQLDADGAVFITDQDDEKLARSRLAAGDVLLTITGAKFGKSAVVTDKHLPGNISQHSVRFSPRADKLDSYFLIAYLNGPTGQIAIWREAYGATRPAIDFPSVRSLIVPSVSDLAQKYIGDKVRQAERLRAWAKETESSVTRYHQALVPSQSTLNFAKRVRLVSPARMSERLDAHFYPGVVDDYLRLHQQKFKPLGELCTTIYNGQTQSETSSAISCKQITVTNLSSSFLGGTPRDVEMPGKKEKFLKPYDILMCNAAHNKTYIGKDLTFVHSDSAILPSTEVMTLRVDRNQVPASYIRAYLLTKLGYVQIQSTIRGITAHSYPDDMALLDIFVPELQDKDKDEWLACDEKLALAGKACEIATQLTHVAKSLVEALIEGQVTEVELIAAEHALQAGNDQPDRHILNRLKTDGVDGQGQPLLSDLDQLYSLLQQADHS